MINTLFVGSDGYLNCGKTLIVAVDGYLNTCSQVTPTRIRGRIKPDDEGSGDENKRLILDDDEIFSIIHCFLVVKNMN